MNEEATPQGAESVHDRLMAKLDPKEEETVSEELESKEEESTEEQEAQPIEAEAEASEEITEETHEESTEQESEPQIELTTVAETLGVDIDLLDADDEGNLLIKTKIDGTDGTAKFTDMLKSYQLEGHLNKQNMEVVELKKSLQIKLNEQDQQLSGKIQQLEDLSQLAYNELLSEYNNVDWKELRETDQSEYAAKQIDFQNRQTRVSQMYQEAQNQRQQANPVNSEEQLNERDAKLLEVYPTWTDPTVAAKEGTDILNYAASLGLQTSEISKNPDYRVIQVLQKAMLFDQLSKDKTQVTKKVKKAPKIAKPGASVSKEQPQERKVKDLRSNIKKTGKGAAEWLLAAGKV